MTTLEFEFKIPLKRDDLRSNESANEYVVSEIYNLKDLEIKIEECKLRAGEIGCDFILEYFPTVFSILHHFNTLDFKILCSFYEDVILKESEGLFNSLSVILADDDIDHELRNKMLNITKMLLYATIEFMKCFQEKIDKIYSLVINEKRKKNTKLMKLKEEHNWDWEANERKALIIINKVVKLPLQRLWDPPTPEEEFVRMIDDCCYNVLEKPSVTSANMKPTRDLIFEILGILIKHYNNAISCKVKIVQLLKLYEHLVVILAQAVIFLVEKYNCRSLIKELILEIIETEEETDTYTQDGSSSRQFSNFIVEIAKLRPQLVLPYINLLINNLSSDPYSMRICVLTVMAEIIINVLQPQGASLSEENIKLRNSFLDHLLDHIYDNNTFVRSRALKLWQSLYKEKSVPTSYIIPLLKRATDRLNDKSSNVVKNSIQLITSMLEENLYGPTLETSAVKQNLRAVKLQLIEAENAKSEPSVFKIWYYSRTDISDFVFKQLKDDEEEGIFDSDNGQSSNDVSLVQKSDVDLSETLSQLQKQVVAQDMEKIFKTLIEFENEHIGKSNFLKSVNDKVQYYEWILGHICKNNTNVREDIIARFASCEDSEDIKNIVDESIQLEDESDSEFGSEKKILTYCEDFLRFVETTSEATAVIREILIRKSAVEVLEAVEFFKVAHQFNLAGADEGVRSMLLLINSKEPGFKDAVKNAFKVLYLQNENSNEYESAVEAVNKLIVLLKKVTHEQKQALANLIKEWVLNKDLGPDFILVLWEKYTRKLPNTSYEDSTAAAVLISMYVSGKPEVIKTNMDMLIKYGLGVNQNNYAFLKQTISMFNALFGIKNEGVSTRYPPDAEIFEKLLSIVHEQFTNLRNGLYPEIAMEAISVIYRLSKNPDTTVGRILKLIHKNLIDEQVENTRVFNCQEELLARFVTVLSHAVFCHWQYLETDVLNELKRRHAKTNAKNKKEKKTTMNKSNSKSMIQKSLAENTTTTDSFEDDTQALASEQIAESVRMVCEKELLYGETLFAKFSLMILSICKQPEKYTNTRLKSAASLALSKLMMVSSVFCSENIQLFVTLMEKSNDVDVRNNLVLAFGDLTFRFPNITDVWTGYFYNRLKDESTNVRYTALVVISHLITNEMIKVRSQMSDVALCLVDSDKLVQNHALHLFYELSLKGNTLYNVMADIISRLSHPDHRPDEKTFQTIMKVLMKLITKDRHLEAIVEKLCHRIRGASDERQCIDLSYCLTLISYSEKTFQKLLDNIICYADKLNYARVHRNFTTVIINCKKLKTGKISEAALELDQKISIILSKGMDNLDADFLKPPKTPMKTPHRGNSSMFKTPASTRKSRLRSAKKVIDFDSDDEE